VSNRLCKTYRVRPNEAGAHGRAKLVAILDYLQDAASEHAAKLGVSLARLQQKHMTWVLVRQWLRMRRLPEQGSRIILETWPAGPRQLYALREFQLRDETGEPLGEACTSWLLIDIPTKRPLRLDKHLPHYPCEPELQFGAGPSSPPQLEHSELSKHFDVRFQDMDINRHVNNTTYVEMALETVPDQILSGFMPVEMRAGFRGEAFFPDEVVCETGPLAEQPQPSFLHRLTLRSTGKELARVISCWQPC
jgi:medium-chain acyl-[acyl-carrier-protein] hydrolase